MANQPGGPVGASVGGPKGMVPGAMAAPVAAAAAAPAMELMNPAQVAQVLGVAEADVMAELDAGNLKGRKIGTQWRITKDAVDAFLKG